MAIKLLVVDDGEDILILLSNLLRQSYSLEKALEDGAINLIKKPLDIDALEELIKRVVL